MRATNSKGMDDGPGDIEALLPWYAAGTLSPRERRRVEDALGRDAALRRQYAAIREEYAETVALNEALGVPSVHALRNLMAAIEAEPARAAAPPPRLGRFTRFFAGLSPRTVAWSASFGAMALLLQAGVIGVILMRSGPETFRSDAYRQLADRMSSAPPVPIAPAAIPASPAPEREARSVPSPDRRELPPQALQADRSRANAVVSAQPQSARRSVALSSATPDSQPRSEVVAAVTFRPEARMSDISALLGSYRASVIGSRDGVLQLRFEGMTTDADLNVILAALSKERIVAKAVAVP